VRVIDYYEASGEGLPHYAQMLRRAIRTGGTGHRITSRYANSRRAGCGAKLR